MTKPLVVDLEAISFYIARLGRIGITLTTVPNDRYAYTLKRIKLDGMDEIEQHEYVLNNFPDDVKCIVMIKSLTSDERFLVKSVRMTAFDALNWMDYVKSQSNRKCEVGIWQIMHQPE